VRRPSPPSWRQAATPIALAAVSLFAALVLWVVVTEAENPREVRDFGGVIPIRAVNVPEGMAVRSFTEDGVRIRVIATREAFEDLATGDFVAEVNMSGVTQTTSTRVVTVRVVGATNVDIVDVSPAFVDVVMEPQATKQVPVQVNRIGSPPQGYNVSGTETNPANARVTGATSLIQLVESVTLDVNLTGARVNIQQQPVLTPRDASGAAVRGLAVEPRTAEVRMSIVQQDATLTMPVQPQLQGSVTEGYNIVGVTTDPPTVTVSGGVEVLQSVTLLATEPIDLSGLRADVTRTVRLRPLPGGLQASRDSVTVNIKVAPAQGARALGVAPEVAEVAQGLSASLQTMSVTVIIQGQEPILRALTPGSIKAVVNVSGLQEGVHVLTPQIQVPQGVTLVSHQPAQVVVVLRR
jgi:YbbR domain-containing protein